MRPNPTIDHEVSKGRSSAEIVRRLYLTDTPVSLKDKQEVLFDICNVISAFFSIPIYLVRVAGSAQTGCSFHNNRDFAPGDSDCDIAVISEHVFEKYLRAVQTMALPNPETLEKPNRQVFPSKQGESYFYSFMTNVTFFGVLMPFQMPACPEKQELTRMTGKISERYADIFSNVNIAIYLSHAFFERKQQPTLVFYKTQVTR